MVIGTRFLSAAGLGLGLEVTRTLSREAKGRLGLYSLEVESRFHLLLLWPALRLETHARWASVRVARAERVEIATRHPGA